MGLFDRVERGLERAVNGAFSKAFRSELQPVEIAAAIRRRMDDRAALLGQGRTMVPNLYTIELNPTDYDRLAEFEAPLAEELVAAAAEHAETQRYQPGGPLAVHFTEADDLRTGTFRITSGSSRKGMPPAARPSAGRSALPYAAPAPEPPRYVEPTWYDADSADQSAVAPGADQDAAPNADDPMAAAPTARAHRQPPAFDPLADDPFAPPAASSPAASPASAAAAAAGIAAAAGAAGTAAGAAAASAPGPAIPAPAAPPRPAPSRHDHPHHRVPSTAGAMARPWLDIDGERYPLIAAMSVLGRDETCDIVIEDPGVSRRHCEFRVTTDGPHIVCSVRDLASTNGTFVNAERVTSQRLEPGDKVTTGRTTFTYRAGRR